MDDEDAERLMSDGLSSDDAQHVALGRFGDVAEIADSFNATRPARRRGLAIGVSVLVLALALTAATLLATQRTGNDPNLARELGFVTKRLQEPSDVEVNGVPLPKSAYPDTASQHEFELFEQRMAVLDR